MRRFDAVRPHLTERQRRVWLGAEARELGSGGVRIVAEAVRVSPDTIRRGRTSSMTRSRWRLPARAGPAGAANGPRNSIPALLTRWTGWSSPSRGATR